MPWQNSTDFGSPPCSPQMPHLRYLRVCRPSFTAISMSLPTAPMSRAWKGSCSRIAAVPEHRVGLVKLLHAVLHLLEAHAQVVGQRLLVLLVMRQELVQRRVEQADRHRQALHRLEDADEVFPLVGEQLRQCPLARLD